MTMMISYDVLKTLMFYFFKRLMLDVKLFVFVSKKDSNSLSLSFFFSFSLNHQINLIIFKNQYYVIKT